MTDKEISDTGYVPEDRVIKLATQAGCKPRGSLGGEREPEGHEGLPRWRVVAAADPRREGREPGEVRRDRRERPDDAEVREAVTPGVRAGIAAAVVVAAVVGVVFPYATLRLGFGPNVSLVSTLLGYVALAGARARGRLALHATHAAGVAAGQTSFMGVALVAFEILRTRHGVAFGPRPSLVELFVWLASAGILGILAALPLRRHYIEDEKLTFAAGAAAAETILALEAEEGSRRTPVLAASFAASVAFMRAAPDRLGRRPARRRLGDLAGRARGGIHGARLGGLAAFPGLHSPVGGVLPDGLRRTDGGRAAAPGAPSSREARGLASHRASPDRAGRGLVGWPLAGVGVALLCLCAVDVHALNLPVSLTLASVAIAAPLLLVGTRVLGETNWAPVLSLATVAQKPRSEFSRPGA